MCNPAAALAAVQVANTVASALGQGVLARRQEDIFEMTKADAMLRANADISQLRTRQRQERMSAAEELEALRRRALESAGTAAVAGAEAGTTAGSVRDVLEQFTKEELTFRFRTERNLEFQAAAFEAQEEATRRRQRNEILAAAPTVAAPDFALVGLQIATDLILADLTAAKDEPGFLGFQFGGSGAASGVGDAAAGFTAPVQEVF